MGAAITLRNIIGETQDLFPIAVIPLHRDFNRDSLSAGLSIEGRRMNNGLILIDIFNKSFDTPGKSEIFFFSGPLIE